MHVLDLGLLHHHDPLRHPGPQGQVPHLWDVGPGEDAGHDDARGPVPVIVGVEVGPEVGELVGDTVGPEVGPEVGEPVGIKVGPEVGELVGGDVG